MARAGRRVVRELLPGLREELGADFVVANGENAAGGIGITPKEADELFAARRRRDHARQPHLPPPRDLALPRASSRDILRPYNFLPHPARARDLRGRARRRLARRRQPRPATLHMQAGAPALVAIDDALREVAGADHVLVDMHAEATSEKVALGWYLDGKVTAVVGTHTHVPTADARVLPGGTAYITDVGMTGARGGVIG